MGSSLSFSMQILSISWPWGLFVSKSSIIFSMTFTSKAVDDKDSFDFCGPSDGKLLALLKDFSLSFKIYNKFIFMKNWRHS